MGWPDGPFPCSGKQGFDRKKKAEEGVLQRPHLQLAPPQGQSCLGAFTPQLAHVW